MKTKLILDTEICRIIQKQTGYHTYIRAKDGSWVEMVEYQNDLKGLVNALDLALNACSGKFYPAKGTAHLDRLQIEEQKKGIEHKVK